MIPSIESVSLVYECDSYVLYLSHPSEKSVSLDRVLVYYDNVNRDPVDVRFFDLPQKAREACLHQVRRRYDKKTIAIRQP